MRKLSFYFITLLLAILVLFTGCKEDTNLKKNSIALDTSKKQSATVTDLEGASFNVESGGTTATVIAMPGVFPAGTNLSVTPLSKDKGLKGEKLSTCFELKAIHEGKSIQPSMPVFLTLAVEKDLPESACLVAYNDGESIGYQVKSQILRENRISYVTAELNHFTILVIGEDGESILIPPPADETSETSSSGENTENDGEWKEWRFVANGPAKEFSMAKDNEIWDFEGSMELTAVNTSGTISGEYFGKPVITVTGKAKEGIVPSEANMEFIGDINLTLSGEMEFILTPMPANNVNIPTELLPDDPSVDVGEFLHSLGNMQLHGDASLDVHMEGQNVLSDAGYQGNTGQTETSPYYISVSAKGAYITIGGIGTWDAVMVGVPKGSLSMAGSSEMVPSSDTEGLASPELPQLEGGFSLTREGWPTGDISENIPEYTMGEVINSGGTESDYTILVDNTSEEDLNKYLLQLEDNGWYTRSDYAEKQNISLNFQFNAENLLQISVYTQELGIWPSEKIPAEIVPPEKGILIGDVETSGDSNAYYISFEYSGLSEDDLRQYMESYLERGWTGDEYYIRKNINWKGKNYRVNIEPMPDGDNVFFICNMMAQ